MRSRLGADVELIRSGGGVFEITVDGKLVYSKKATGEFPDEESLLEKLGT
jgi:selenoprotein W-related protein